MADIVKWLPSTLNDFIQCFLCKKNSFDDLYSKIQKLFSKIFI